MNHTASLVTDALAKLPDIRAAEQLMADAAQWNALPAAEREHRSSTLEESQRTVAGSLQLANETVAMTAALTEEIQEPFLAPELAGRVAAMLTSVLYRLAGPRGVELKVGWVGTPPASRLPVATTCRPHSPTPTPLAPTRPGVRPRALQLPAPGDAARRGHRGGQLVPRRPLRRAGGAVCLLQRPPAAQDSLHLAPAAAHARGAPRGAHSPSPGGCARLPVPHRTPPRPCIAALHARPVSTHPHPRTHTSARWKRWRRSQRGWRSSRRSSVMPTRRWRRRQRSSWVRRRRRGAGRATAVTPPSLSPSLRPAPLHPDARPCATAHERGGDGPCQHCAAPAQ